MILNEQSGTNNFLLKSKLTRFINIMTQFKQKLFHQELPYKLNNEISYIFPTNEISYMTPNKESQFLFPNNESQFMFPNKDSQYIFPNKQIPYMIPGSEVSHEC
jgi:hypothetical protein